MDDLILLVVFCVAGLMLFLLLTALVYGAVVNGGRVARRDAVPSALADKGRKP